MEADQLTQAIYATDVTNDTAPLESLEADFPMVALLNATGVTLPRADDVATPSPADSPQPANELASQSVLQAMRQLGVEVGAEERRLPEAAPPEQEEGNSTLQRAMPWQEGHDKDTPCLRLA